MGETTWTAPAQIARAVTDLVGDGCIVRLADRARGVMPVAAVAHRDSRRGQQLSELLAASEPALSEGWPGQALSKNLAFRLEHAAAVEAAGAEAHAGEVYAAVVAPLRQDGDAIGTVIALRDSVELPYSLREQQLIEELALGDAGASEPIPSVPAPDRVLEHAAAGVWTTDLDGITTYVNEATSALVGVPACQLVGAPMAVFVDEEPQVIHARLSPSTERQDHRLIRPDGTEVWVSMTTTPLSDARGRRVGTVSTLFEIGERKRVETELRLRAATQEAVRGLAERALAGEGLERLTQRAVATAADILGAEYATVAGVEPAREAVVPRVVVGWDPALIGQRVPIHANSLTDLCLDVDEPVVGDFETIQALARGEMAEAAEARSAVCVSIAGGSGVLALMSSRADAFTGQDISFLRWIAAILASRWEIAPAPLAAVPA